MKIEYMHHDADVYISLILPLWMDDGREDTINEIESAIKQSIISSPIPTAVDEYLTYILVKTTDTLSKTHYSFNDVVQDNDFKRLFTENINAEIKNKLPNIIRKESLKRQFWVPRKDKNSENLKKIDTENLKKIDNTLSRMLKKEQPTESVQLSPK
jgi:hypothetical protein